MHWPTRHHLKFSGTSAGLLAAVLMAVAAPATVEAQPAPLNADLALRPLTAAEISALKLPSTTQKSNGLTTVGLGQPAYLEMQINNAIKASEIAGVIWTITYKPKDSSAVLEESPLPANTPLFEPADATVAQVAGRKMLRPDVPGMYVVSGTVTAGASGTATVAQTIIAGTYTGRAACEACHSGGLADVKAPSWSKTSHATLFTEGIIGKASDHYGSNCITCHTVGYDANAKAVNGGFDDIAAKVGWTFPATMTQANWDTMPKELQNVANIQCESCHGPGSQHVKSGGDRIEISKPATSGACGVCHDSGTNHIKEREWKASMHAVVTRDPSGAGREGCVGCHTGNGFMDAVKGAAVPNVTYTPITCQTCHEPHGDTMPADKTPHLVRKMAAVTLKDGTQVTDGGAGKLCMNCHMSRQNANTYVNSTAGSARFGPHHGPQADMLAGTNAYTYGLQIPSSGHLSVVADSCATCHMQTVAAADQNFLKAGGHTFRMAAMGADGKTPQEQVAVCQTCHGDKVTTFNMARIDYDGDGVVEGVQTEVQHLLDQLSALLPPDAKTKDALTITSSWTKPQLQAAFNWNFVKEDKSLGIHNTAYAVGILKASIKDLQSQK
jgi:hypothetical protein